MPLELETTPTAQPGAPGQGQGRLALGVGHVEEAHGGVVGLAPRHHGLRDRGIAEPQLIEDQPDVRGAGVGALGGCAGPGENAVVEAHTRPPLGLLHGLGGGTGWPSRAS